MKVTVGDPAGNVTLLVEDEVKKAAYPAVARKLLAELGGEQVGFLTAPRMGGQVRLEMMGGEFCGNAARCAGRYAARALGLENADIKVEVSGCSAPVPVRVRGETAWAEMPLPVSMEEIILEGCPMTAVRLEGIVHLIAEREPLPEQTVARLLPAAAARFQAPAAGMMFLRGDILRPAVYVCKTDSLYWEQSCASGSAAAACYGARGKKDGCYPRTLRQPGGVIETSVSVKQGRCRSVLIGGVVRLEESREI